MGAPPSSGIGSTRAVLVAGAARAFAQRGLRACTMQAVAAAAGVSKATLYNYFRTKDELARALLTAELARMTALAAALPAEQALAALADELGEHPVLRRVAELDPDVFARLVGMQPDTWQACTTRLAAVLGTDADGAETAARWLLGVVLQPGRSSMRHRTAALLTRSIARV